MATLISFNCLAAGSDDTQVAALPADLTQLSIDQLMNIEVTSVSKRPEKLSEAAASVYVLTGEEIRRSGARNIASALRLVPGLEVARSDSRNYAISARGFNNGNSDKLQVLLDGRSVYTPLTSAVFWDVLDTDMEDIDRIEVIRGPGAALWGSNAVNGVINIVTHSSRDTTGTVVSGGVGTEDRARAEIRSGTQIGDDASVRFYAKARDETSALRADGSDAGNAVRSYQAGLRSDWMPRAGNSLTVSADAYSARFNQPASVTSPTAAPTDASGANLTAKWASQTSEDSSWSILGYFDQYHRDIPGIYTELRQTFNLDFQQQFRLLHGNTLIYGLSYRTTHDNTGEPPQNAIVFVPPSRTLQNESGFVQDQWAMDDGKVVLTIGSKLEHDDFNKLELQPSARIAWHLAPEAFTWAAISRAARTPNRINSDIAIFCPAPNGFPGVCGPGLFRIGNPEIRSELLTAYEWGLRLWTSHRLSFDLATYYNDYTDLLSQEGASPSAPLGTYGNKLRAKGYGGELVVDWQPRPTLKLETYYSYLRIGASNANDSTDTTTVSRLETSDPRHQAGLRVSYQPADRWTLDSNLRYVDGLTVYSIPAYTELGVRVGYRVRPSLELYLSGQNLLAPRHAEFGAASSRSDVSRSAFAGFDWHWQ